MKKYFISTALIVLQFFSGLCQSGFQDKVHLFEYIIQQKIVPIVIKKRGANDKIVTNLVLAIEKEKTFFKRDTFKIKEGYLSYLTIASPIFLDSLEHYDSIGIDLITKYRRATFICPATRFYVDSIPIDVKIACLLNIIPKTIFYGQSANSISLIFHLNKVQTKEIYDREANYSGVLLSFIASDLVKASKSSLGEAIIFWEHKKNKFESFSIDIRSAEHQMQHFSETFYFREKGVL